MRDVLTHEDENITKHLGNSYLISYELDSPC